jgi:hypothetical protein
MSSNLLISKLKVSLIDSPDVLNDSIKPVAGASKFEIF